MGRLTHWMVRPVWLAISIVLSLPAFATDIDFSRYHGQDEIAAYLRGVAEDYPDLVRFQLLGESLQGREIAYVVIGYGDPANKPSLFINGTHHGNEKSSTESILGVIDYLIDAAGTVPLVETLLTDYAIYLQPLVNPDGHAASTRSDSRGRDPNRDYAFPGRSEADSFDLPEIRLVKELVDQTEPVAAVAMHSGMEGVLWPWCFTGDRSPHHALFASLSELAAIAMGMTLWEQSFYDYPTRGEFIDYVYMKHGTLGVTFEVSREPTPPPARLATYVRRSVQGTLAFLEGIVESRRDGALNQELVESWREMPRLRDVIN